MDKLRNKLKAHKKIQKEKQPGLFASKHKMYVSEEAASVNSSDDNEQAKIDNKQLKIDLQRKIIKSFNEEIKELQTKKAEAEKILANQILDSIDCLYNIKITNTNTSSGYNTFNSTVFGSAIYDCGPFTNAKDVGEKIAWIKECENIYYEYLGRAGSCCNRLQLKIETCIIFSKDVMVSMLENRIDKNAVDDTIFSDEIMKVVNETKDQGKNK